MDIRAGLLAVLNNPEETWKVVMETLHPSQRRVLLALALTKTPVELEDWQLVSSEGGDRFAAEFEDCLQVLDDTFVKHGRTSIGRELGPLKAEFKNPGIRDFCSNYLEGKPTLVRPAISSATPESLMTRLSEIVTADRPGVGTSRVWTYPRMRGIITGEAPGLLVRASEVAPSERETPESRFISLLELYAAVGSPVEATVALRNFLETHVAGSHVPDALQALMAAARSPRTADALMQIDNGTLLKLRDAYVEIIEARYFDVEVFELAMRVDELLGISGRDVDWATAFESTVQSLYDNGPDDHDPGILDNQIMLIAEVSRFAGLDSGYCETYLSDMRDEAIRNEPQEVEDSGLEGYDASRGDSVNETGNQIDRLFLELLD